MCYEYRNKEAVVVLTTDTQNTWKCMIQQEKKPLYSRHKAAELVILV